MKNCLSVFDHFVKLALKELIYLWRCNLKFLQDTVNNDTSVLDMLFFMVKVSIFQEVSSLNIRKNSFCQDFPEVVF